MKKSQVLKKSVCVEVYNRLAGESSAPDITRNYNWLTVAWFFAGQHTESDVRTFVKTIRTALKPIQGSKPFGRVRVTKDC